MKNQKNLKAGVSFRNIVLNRHKCSSDEEARSKHKCNVVVIYRKNPREKDKIVTPVLWQKMWNHIQDNINHESWDVGDYYCYTNSDTQVVVIFVLGGSLSDDNILPILSDNIQIACCKLKKIEQVALYLPEERLDDVSYVFQLLHNINFSGHKFNKYITTKQTGKSDTDKPAIKEICLHASDNQYRSVHDVWHRVHATMWAKACTRDWGNEPANVLYPESFVKSIQETVPDGLKVEIWDRAKLEREEVRALLGVAQGSLKQPYVVVMSWHGKQDDTKDVIYDIALAGKGVTFDSGGINIKPSNGMEDMKFDMCGAATVVGILMSLAKNKVTVNALGVIGLVENMPSGSAQRPGDIAQSMSGKTIEILNTDAEGRLVLADVLTIIQNKYKVQGEIMTLATLTGSVVAALGEIYGGMFSYNKLTLDSIQAVASSVGEKLWPLPLHAEYDNMIKSKVADVANISTSGSGAGSITAAQFLGRFVQDDHRQKWVHFDIAGVASVNDYATGFGVIALSEWIRKTYS